MKAEASPAAPAPEGIARLRIVLRGAVQGLGIRPAIYRLAMAQGLAGWVRNAAVGVEVEVEGSSPALKRMLKLLAQHSGELATGYRVESSWCAVVGYSGFAIVDSAIGAVPATAVLPDRACCRDCLRELFDTGDRRFRYPFINCTRCGPRYSIIASLPYDRERTAMRDFSQCADCRGEYEDPADRRFHAQPNACARCGPQLALWSGTGSVLAQQDAALSLAVAALGRGEVLAVKGLGGFQLMVDARNAQAVNRLRARKRRGEKPFALMCPDDESVARLCTPDAMEWSLLHSPEAPIVLLRKADSRATETDAAMLASVALGYPDIGIMLPYTPLHHLLLHDVGFPVVATSGNGSGDALCSDEGEALRQLAGIADLWLVHDRPILHPVDDSIARVVAGRTQVLRLGRGYAPLLLETASGPAGTLAVGGHQNSAVALSTASGMVLGPHIGDLDSASTRHAHGATMLTMAHLYGTKIQRLCSDLHPDYASANWALTQRKPVLGVQHHYAHALACMADNQLCEDVLAVVWDGAGYGLDGTIWGGEFLRVDQHGFSRVARWQPFPLPGGEAAVREPCRVAFALLHALFGELVSTMEEQPAVCALTPAQRRVMLAMLVQRLNTPLTSSVGRLFDGVAALLDICQRMSSQGHAACLLEAQAWRVSSDPGTYPVGFSTEDGLVQLDWEPLLRALLADRQAAEPVEICAARFHHALVDALVAVAQRVDCEQVALSGGCFGNRYLAEHAIARLRAAGFQPYWHRRVPPNDGGLALGQLMAAGRI
jgi:hydrogenase maturation protein HypF